MLNNVIVAYQKLFAGLIATVICIPGIMLTIVWMVLLVKYSMKVIVWVWSF